MKADTSDATSERPADRQGEREKFRARLTHYASCFKRWCENPANVSAEDVLAAENVVLAAYDAARPPVAPAAQGVDEVGRLSVEFSRVVNGLIRIAMSIGQDGDDPEDDPACKAAHAELVRLYETALAATPPATGAPPAAAEGAAVAWQEHTSRQLPVVAWQARRIGFGVEVGGVPVEWCWSRPFQLIDERDLYLAEPDKYEVRALGVLAAAPTMAAPAVELDALDRELAAAWRAQSAVEPTASAEARKRREQMIEQVASERFPRAWERGDLTEFEWIVVEEAVDAALGPHPQADSAPAVERAEAVAEVYGFRDVDKRPMLNWHSRPVRGTKLYTAEALADERAKTWAEAITEIKAWFGEWNSAGDTLIADIRKRALAAPTAQPGGER